MNVPEGYPPILAQPIVHWLANILASQALAEYQTLDEILKIRPPDGRSYCLLEWADHMLDKPVFPEWCANGKTSKARSPTAWGTQASAWAIRSGLTNGLGFHSARRKALINCNGKSTFRLLSDIYLTSKTSSDAGYSLGQTLKFASQNNTNVLVNNYLGPVSSVDGTSTYHGLPPRKDLAEDFLSATMKWNPDLRFHLSPKKRQEIETSQPYLSLTNEIHSLSCKIAVSDAEDTAILLKAQRAVAYRKRQALFDSELRKLQLSQKLNYDTGRPAYQETNWQKGHFERIKHMLSTERVRLSHTMKTEASPRSPTWKQAVQDLVNLRNEDCRVAYQDGLQPINGFCPVDACTQEMEKYG